MPTIFSHSLGAALQNKRLSSANNKWVSLRPRQHKEKPLMSPVCIACFMSPYSPSVHSRKRKKDSGSPCLIPLVGCIIP